MTHNIINKNNTYKNSPIYNTLQPSSKQKIADPPKLFGFYRLSSKTFVGRNTDVGLLFRLFKDHQKILITGIAGLGKTSLASLCATTWVNKNEFKYAAIINAETDISAQHGFANLAKKIYHNTDKTISEIYEHYSKLRSKTLFVLDNIEINCDVHKYLPDEKLTNVFVLGTSQYTEFKRIFELYELEKLCIHSSVDMIRGVLLNLKKTIDIKKINNQNITKLITDIAGKLDCHPLALEHAAAYIVDCILYNEMSVLASVEHYIETFNVQLEKEPPLEHPTTYRRSVYTALKMNIEKATSKSEHARKLLFCLSFLRPTYIDKEMFYKHPDFNREHIKAPIRELKKYSIISLNNGYISLHRLIQTVYRDLIKKKNTEENYIPELLNVLFYVDDIYLITHFSYLIQNLNINKETMSTLYIKAFRSNDKIIHSLTARLRLINCNMDDIKDWSALHCSVYARHKTFFEYFDTSECGNREDRLGRFASDTWTVFHTQIIRDSSIYLFWNEINLIPVFEEPNKKQKNKKIVKGLTILNLCAAFNVDGFYIRKLINIGCDVNIPDDSGMTPILYAAKNLAYKLVFILHRAGATYDQSYKNILSAASNGDHELVLALLRISDIDCAASDFSKTLLFWAVNERYCDLALELIERHTDINGADSYGNTVALVATKRGLSKVVAELRHRGVYIETIDNDDGKLLLAAAETESSEAVAELLRRGVNIETINNRGETPLLVAALRGRSEVVVELLCRGASIDAKNNWGKTALSIAEREGHSTIVQLLNEHRARTDSELS